MSTIKIPTKFKEVELSELTSKDLQEMFAFNNELVKLQQYTIEQSFNLEESFSITSIEVLCNEKFS